ncbi:MAG: sulfite exporter TauE/SafE family protein [Ferruginibacter sp.]
MEITGYLLAAMVGLSLGLIGSGGSVLTVPILVYVMGVNPVLATSYSLFIVGCTSLVGATNNYIRGLVDTKTALLFGITSVIVVFVTRHWLLPQIPETLFYVRGFTVTKSIAAMLLFAVLMVFSSMAMIRSSRFNKPANTTGSKQTVLSLTGYGIAIGLVTGLLGAGGGFLIIPVLVLMMGLPIRQAVGTSLLIIALNSLIGFAGDIGHYNTNWHLLLTVTTVSVAGIFAGTALSRKIHGPQLKKIFGWFVLIMGIYIIARELFFSTPH